MAGNDAPEQCCLRMANVKGLVEAIQAVKSPNKHQVIASDPFPGLLRCYSGAHRSFLKASLSMQLCLLSINRDGLSLRWEDTSKGMQSSVWLHSEVRAELFTSAAA